MLAGEGLLLRDFTDADQAPFIALSRDEAIFTYTKGRRTDYSTRKEMFLGLLAEPALTPRASYTLVIETSTASLGTAG